jgi:hypothetical protein
MTGRELYERFVEVGTSGGEWVDLHQMDRDGWDLLAADRDIAVRDAATSAVHWVANEITDAWERREQRRCPSTT